MVQDLAVTPEGQHPPKGTHMPIDIVILIAVELRKAACFGTLASLSTCSRLLREVALSVLYETFTLQYSQLKIEAEAVWTSHIITTRYLSSGWHHVK